jgi:hypothetical protein
VLHPAWRAVLPDQRVFSEFLCHAASWAFLRSWAPGLRKQDLALPDVTLFVNPREGDFSEGWHRDTRWRALAEGSTASLQQDSRTNPQQIDWSVEAERQRWSEIQGEREAAERRSLAANGISLLLALVPEESHELVPRSHREFRTVHAAQGLWRFP